MSVSFFSYYFPLFAVIAFTGILLPTLLFLPPDKLVRKEPQHTYRPFYYWPCRLLYSFLLFTSLLALVANRGAYHISLFSSQIAVPPFQNSQESGPGQNYFSGFCLDVCDNHIAGHHFRQGMEYKLCFICCQPLFPDIFHLYFI